MDEYEELPRLSYKLIEMLDQTVPLPTLPCTPKAAAGLTEEQMRRMAFIMGMRAIVNDLVDTMNEERREKGEELPEVNPADGLTHGEWDGLARIMGSDGEIKALAGGGWVDVGDHEKMISGGHYGRPLPANTPMIKDTER